MQKIFPYIIIFLFFLIGSCKGPINQIDESSYGDTDLKKGTPKNQIELTQSEIDGILFMREEEKLAHDVYVQFYELYGHQIFLNISISEQKHMDAILRLINFYKLEDSSSNELGVFNNEELKDLYSDLMGMADDLISALEVGVIIEETDIVDISEYIEETEVKNLDQVYGNLLNGSYNHLKSFNKVLEQLEKKDSK